MRSTTTWVDMLWFPHIVDLILSFAAADDADPRWLATLAIVCRRWRQLVHCRIGYHQQLTVYRLPAAAFKRRHPSFRKVRFAGYEHGRAGRALAASLRFNVLQPALYPGRDVCDLKVLAGSSYAPIRSPALTFLERAGGVVPLVSHARVLTVRFARLLRYDLNRLMPRLHTMRMDHKDGYQGMPLPAAHTYVWFRNPTKRGDELEFEGENGEVETERVRLCSDATQKLVFCIRRGVEDADNTVIPPTVRPANVKLVVVVMDNPHALQHGWLVWALRNRFNVVLLVSDAFFASKCLPFKARGWVPTSRKLNGRSYPLCVVSASAYKRKFGEATLRAEASPFLLENEAANYRMSRKQPSKSAP